MYSGFSFVLDGCRQILWFPHHSQPLVDVSKKPSSTHLDQYLYCFRTTNLQQIVQAALKLKHEDSDLLSVLDQAEDWASRLKSMAEEVETSFLPCTGM